ncbi:MAG: FAD-dependent oxidoreductase [Sphaerochaetaceae bacterium]|nr:FAD-dependent oxidoreductase [Sphaerochaetaceae bacterium]
MANLYYDIVVIGGGPAGLSCGQYGARAGRKTAVIEEMACGGQTMIIDEIENYPGLEKLPGYEIGVKFEEQAKRFGCEFIYGTAGTVRKCPDGTFETEVNGDTVSSKAVVIATGSKHRTLGIPGEKEFTGHGVSYCATCDGPFFKGKKILVCGGGDSAVQEAFYLTKLTDRLTVCHRRDRFRAQAANVEKLKSVSAVNFKMNQVVVSINGTDGKVSSVTFSDNVTGKKYTEDFDAVFVFAGNEPRTDIVPDCIKDEAGFIVTDAFMETNVHGIFAVGDVRNTPFRQIVTAASDGAVAAHSASNYIDSLSGI